MSAEGWVLVIGAVAGGLTALYVAIMKGRKEQRTDAITEWKEYADRLEKRLDKVQDSQTECEKRSMAQQVQITEQNGEIKLLVANVQRLQGLAGDDAPATVVPVVIVADINGTIKQASPGITPLLHWMVKDLLGKSIELLIPERFVEKHRAGMVALKAGGPPPWTDRVILGYANLKDGGEVAVAVTLSAWQDKGAWMISAEVKKRLATALVDGGRT